jgi:hypothetical protein
MLGSNEIFTLFSRANRKISLRVITTASLYFEVVQEGAWKHTPFHNLDTR